MAVTEAELDAWWSARSDDERAHLMDVSAIQPTMDPRTEALVATLPGLPRMRGSFGGAPFPERLPEPLRTYVRHRRNERD